MTLPLLHGKCGGSCYYGYTAATVAGGAVCASQLLYCSNSGRWCCMCLTAAILQLCPYCYSTAIPLLLYPYCYSKYCYILTAIILLYPCCYTLTAISVLILLLYRYICIASTIPLLLLLLYTTLVA